MTIPTYVLTAEESMWVETTAIAALLVMAVMVGGLVVSLLVDLDEDVRRDISRARSIVRQNRRMLRLRLRSRVEAGELHHVGPVRLQQRRLRGWKTPPDAIRVGRGTRWGNPWRVGDRVAMPDHDGSVVVTPELAVALFAAYVMENGFLPLAVEELAGHDLVCWCKIGQPCHGEWLLEVANGSSIVAPTGHPAAIDGYNALTHEYACHKL